MKRKRSLELRGTNQIVPLSERRLDRLEQLRLQREQRLEMTSLFDPIFNISAQNRVSRRYGTDYNVLLGYLDLAANNIKPYFQGKAGQGIMANMRVLGDTADQAFGANIIKSGILAALGDGTWGENIKKSYGLGRGGRYQMDTTRIRESLNQDFGTIGNTIFDLAGEILLDPSTYFSLGATKASKGVVSSTDEVADFAKVIGDEKLAQRLGILALNGDKKGFETLLISANKGLDGSEITSYFTSLSKAVKANDKTARRIFKFLDTLDEVVMKSSRHLSPPYVVYKYAAKPGLELAKTTSMKAIKDHNVQKWIDSLASDEEYLELSKKYEFTPMETLNKAIKDADAAAKKLKTPESAETVKKLHRIKLNKLNKDREEFKSVVETLRLFREGDKFKDVEEFDRLVERLHKLLSENSDLRAYMHRDPMTRKMVLDIDTEIKNRIKDIDKELKTQTEIANPTRGREAVTDTDQIKAIEAADERIIKLRADRDRLSGLQRDIVIKKTHIIPEVADNWSHDPIMKSFLEEIEYIIGSESIMTSKEFNLMVENHAKILKAVDEELVYTTKSGKKITQSYTEHMLRYFEIRPSQAATSRFLRIYHRVFDHDKWKKSKNVAKVMAEESELRNYILRNEEKIPFLRDEIKRIQDLVANKKIKKLTMQRLKQESPELYNLVADVEKYDPTVLTQQKAVLKNIEENIRRVQGDIQYYKNGLKIPELGDKAEEYNNSLAKKSLELKELKAQKRSVEYNIKRVSEYDISEADKFIDYSEERIRILKRINAIDEEIAEARKALDPLEDANIEELRAREEELVKEVTPFKQRKDALEKEFKAAEKEWNQVADKELQKLEDEHRLLISELSRIEQDMKKVEISTHPEVDDKQLQSWKDEIKDLKRQRNEPNTPPDQKLSMEYKIDELEGRIQGIKSSRIELERLREKYLTLNSRLDSLGEELTTKQLSLPKETIAAQTKYAVAKRNFERAQLDWQNKRAEVIRVTSDTTKYDNTFAETHGKIAKLEDEKARLLAARNKLDKKREEFPAFNLMRKMPEGSIDFKDVNSRLEFVSLLLDNVHSFEGEGDFYLKRVYAKYFYNIINNHEAKSQGSLRTLELLDTLDNFYAKISRKKGVVSPEDLKTMARIEQQVRNLTVTETINYIASNPAEEAAGNIRSLIDRILKDVEGLKNIDGEDIINSADPADKILAVHIVAARYISFLKFRGKGEVLKTIELLRVNPELLVNWFAVIKSLEVYNSDLAKPALQMQGLFNYLLSDNWGLLVDGTEIDERTIETITNLYNDTINSFNRIDIDSAIAPYIKPVHEPTVLDVVEGVFKNLLADVDTHTPTKGVSIVLQNKQGVNFNLTDPEVRYVLGDFEATGLSNKDPNNMDQITEAGLQEFNYNEEGVFTFHSRFEGVPHPKDPTRKTRVARLGKGVEMSEDVLNNPKLVLTKEMIQEEGAELADVMRAYTLQLIGDGTRPTVFVAHNARFDWDFYINTLKALGMYDEFAVPLNNIVVLDTMGMAKLAVYQEVMANRTGFSEGALAELLVGETPTSKRFLDKLEVVPDGTEDLLNKLHRADYDVSVMAELMDELMRRLQSGEYPVKTLNDLVTFANVDLEDTLKSATFEVTDYKKVVKAEVVDDLFMLEKKQVLQKHNEQLNRVFSRELGYVTESFDNLNGRLISGSYGTIFGTENYLSLAKKYEEGTLTFEDLREFSDFMYQEFLELNKLNENEKAMDVLDKIHTSGLEEPSENPRKLFVQELHDLNRKITEGQNKYNQFKDWYNLDGSVKEQRMIMKTVESSSEATLTYDEFMEHIQLKLDNIRNNVEDTKVEPGSKIKSEELIPVKGSKKLDTIDTIDDIETEKELIEVYEYLKRLDVSFSIEEEEAFYNTDISTKKDMLMDLRVNNAKKLGKATPSSMEQSALSQAYATETLIAELAYLESLPEKDFREVKFLLDEFFEHISHVGKSDNAILNETVEELRVLHDTLNEAYDKFDINKMLREFYDKHGIAYGSAMQNQNEVNVMLMNAVKKSERIKELNWVINGDASHFGEGTMPWIIATAINRMKKKKDAAGNLIGFPVVDDIAKAFDDLYDSIDFMESLFNVYEGQSTIPVAGIYDVLTQTKELIDRFIGEFNIKGDTLSEADALSLGDYLENKLFNRYIGENPDFEAFEGFEIIKSMVMRRAVSHTKNFIVRPDKAFVDNIYRKLREITVTLESFFQRETVSSKTSEALGKSDAYMDEWNLFFNEATDSIRTPLTMAKLRNKRMENTPIPVNKIRQDLDMYEGGLVAQNSSLVFKYAPQFRKKQKTKKLFYRAARGNMVDATPLWKKNRSEINILDWSDVEGTKMYTIYDVFAKDLGITTDEFLRYVGNYDQKTYYRIRNIDLFKRGGDAKLQEELDLFFANADDDFPWLSDPEEQKDRIMAAYMDIKERLNPEITHYDEELGEYTDKHWGPVLKETNRTIKDVSKMMFATQRNVNEFLDLFDGNDQMLLDFFNNQKSYEVVIYQADNTMKTLRFSSVDDIQKLRTLQQNGNLIAIVNKSDYYDLQKYFRYVKASKKAGQGSKFHKWLVTAPKMFSLFNIPFAVGNAIEGIAKNLMGGENPATLLRDFNDANKAYNLWIKESKKVAFAKEMFDELGYSSTYRWTDWYYVLQPDGTYVTREIVNGDKIIPSRIVSGDEVALIKKTNEFFTTEAGSVDMQSFSKSLNAVGSSTKKSAAENFADKVVFNKMIMKNFELNAYLEGVSRYAMFLNSTRNGLLEDEAFAKVINSFFSYGGKSQTETMAEFIIPFLSFPLRNYMYFMEALENPTVSKTMARAVEVAWGGMNINDNDYYQYRLESGAIPVADGLMFDTNLGITEAMTLVGDPFGSAKRKLHPFMKLGYAGIQSVRDGSMELAKTQALRQPGISIGVNMFEGVENLLSSERSLDGSLGSLFSRYYTEEYYRFNRYRGRSIHDDLYTSNGYSRWAMQSQLPSAHNLKYRTQNILYQGYRSPMSFRNRNRRRY